LSCGACTDEVLAVVTVGRDQQSLAIEAALEREDEPALEALLRA